MAKKLYFKIGEACKKLGIQPYVLRYWETEFPLLNPDKSKSGQRVYSQRELEIIGRIKDLLYEEGYTIAGAKKKLEAELQAGSGGEDSDPGSGSTAASKTSTYKVKSNRKTSTKLSANSGADTPASAASISASVTEEVASEQLVRLRDGLTSALRQAREILERFGSTTS